MVELAFAAVIAGLVLGFIWIKVTDVIEGAKIESASKEMHAIMQAVRDAHPNDKLVEHEDVFVEGLEEDLSHRVNNHSYLYSPWHGPVTTMPGNAVGWGADQYNDEFTIRFDGISPPACLDMAMRTANEMQGQGLVAIYISPALGEGQEFCFMKDAFCTQITTTLNKEAIKPLCNGHNPMTVMFTYQLHM